MFPRWKWGKAVFCCELKTADLLQVVSGRGIIESNTSHIERDKTGDRTG